MGKVIIFGGTSEGRHLAEFCVRRRIPSIVTVVSDYGKELLPESPYLTVLEKALTQEEMKALLEKERPELAVDATHPYAARATEYISTTCEELGIRLVRVLRKAGNVKGHAIMRMNSPQEAAAYLSDKKGNILLTTGTKDLKEFTVIPGYEERIFARILPSMESLEKCHSLSIRGKHVIAMEGPFSKDMNKALIDQLGIRFLVTKESGAAGGFEEKLQGAEEAGAEVVVIGRPCEEEGVSEEEAKKILEPYGKEEKRKIFLIGAGMGGPGQLTEKAAEALKKCQAVFGAERVVNAVSSKVSGSEVVAEYQPEQILSWLKAHPYIQTAAAVYSGDTGFYSGASLMMKRIRSEEEFESEVIPGISAVSYLAACLGKNWQDISLLSCHGRELRIREELGKLEKKKAIFLLTEGKNQINEICREIQQEEENRKGTYRIFVGENLSYGDERIREGRPGELINGEYSSLAALWIEKEDS